MTTVLIAFEPPDGGVAEHIRGLALGLAERGHEVEVAGPMQSPIFAELEAAGIPVHTTSVTGSIGAIGSDIATGRELRALLAGGRFDIGHAHGMKAGVLLRLVGASRRVPIVYTSHCFAFISNEFRDDLSYPHLRRALVINAERGLGLLTARLVCVSGFELGYADRLHIVPKRRRRLIHNGVSLDLNCEPDPELLDWRGDGLLFGTVSTLFELKGLQYVVEAAKLLGERAPGLKLAIVGDGPMQNSLEVAIQREGLGSRIRVFGFGGRVEPHLLALDGFMLASYKFESLPIGVIEAMGAGLSVIGTTVGGVPELVQPGRTGMLVRPADPAALADAIVELASEPRRRAALGAGALDLVAEEFSLTQMLDRLEALYAELAG